MQPSSPKQSTDYSSLEFAVYYAGLIPDVAIEEDASSRTNVLKLIDQAITNGDLPRNIPNASPVNLRVSLHAIFVFSFSLVEKFRLEDEELLLSLPIHMVMAVSFVCDNTSYIIGMKIGEVGPNKDLCDFAVFYCQSYKQAEDICLKINNCFQQVFTEAFVEFSEKKVAEGHSRTLSFMEEPIANPSSCEVSLNEPSYDSAAKGDLEQSSIFMSSTSPSDSDKNSAFCADVIQSYMYRLQSLLSVQELKQFAFLMKGWRAEKLPLEEFCHKVLEIYGSERRHLLVGLRPFIPTCDLKCFQDFLQRYGITGNVQNSSAYSSSPASTGPSPEDSSKIRLEGRKAATTINEKMSVSDYSGTMVESADGVPLRAEPLSSLRMVEVEASVISGDVIEMKDLSLSSRDDCRF